MSNSASVHNPLLIPELFHCVLDCLDIELPAETENCATLAVLARTCRAFSEPSLNLLWRHLDSLLPLIRCFSHVVDETRVKVWSNHYYLHSLQDHLRRCRQTPPSPLEWLVINRYSPRIQELTLGDEHLSILFLQCTNLSLPNLRVFRWARCVMTRRGRRPLSIDSIATLWPLLPTQIDTLEVSLSGANDQKFRSFLEDYPISPNLKSIKFDFPGVRVPFTSYALSRAICCHSDWQRIELSPAIDVAAFKHLALSPKLKTAWLSLTPESTASKENLFRPGDTLFCNVRCLTLTLWNHLDFVTSLLQACGQAFHHFGVIFHDIPTAMEVYYLLTAIASPQRIHSLQSLMIRDPQRRRTSITAKQMQRLSCITFRPLASLVHLRELIFNLDHLIALNDEEFTDLVCNWPSLEVLRFTGFHEEDPAKSITFNGLLSLLTSCPRLREIRLPLDARHVPMEACLDVCCPSVTCLLFQDSPIKTPVLVAEFLSTCLPYVRSVYTTFTEGLFGDARRTYQQLWMHVNRRMAEMRGDDPMITNGPLFPLSRLIHP